MPQKMPRLPQWKHGFLKSGMDLCWVLATLLIWRMRECQKAPLI
jgi:hypothetical protein